MSDPAVTTASTTEAAGAAAATAGNGTATTTTAAASTTTADTKTTDAKVAADAATTTTAAASTATKEPAKADADIALTMPKDALLPATSVEEVKAFAKEHGLSAKAAQAVLEGRNAAVVAHHQAQEAAFQNLVTSWDGEIKADKEIGGDAHDANMALADRTLKSFASDKFIQALDQSGLGKNPEFRRFLVRVGKASSEDGVSAARASAGAASQRSSDEASLRARYPSMYAGATG